MGHCSERTIKDTDRLSAKWAYLWVVFCCASSLSLALRVADILHTRMQTFEDSRWRKKNTAGRNIVPFTLEHSIMGEKKK